MIFLGIISCSVRLEPRKSRSLGQKSVLVEIVFPKLWHTDNVSVLSLDDKKPISCTTLLSNGRSQISSSYLKVKFKHFIFLVGLL